MKLKASRAALSVVLTMSLGALIFGQSGHASRGDAATEGTVLNVIATRNDGKGERILPQNINLFENGVEQKIKNFTADPSPSRIVILVDNSQSLQISVDDMKKAVMEFAYEIFEGDQLFVIAYDTKPEIIQEWTDDAKKVEASLSTLRKKGNAYLFDAVEASVKDVLRPLMPGMRKTAVVLISDGLDRGSTSKFDKTLNLLLDENVVLYSLQIPDRTGGAYRRDQPKASVIMTRLAEESGGLVFPFEESSTAAKTICDELHKNRYLLSYISPNASSFDSRKLLLVGDEGLSLRIKSSQPPNVK